MSRSAASPTVRTRLPIALLAAVSLAVGACAATSDAATPPPSPSPSPSPAPVEQDPTHPVVVDWNGPTVTPVDLADGWHVEPCVDGASVLCVTDPSGAAVGTIELGTWTTAGDVGPIAAWLREQVQDFIATFAADRLETCGAGYELRLDGAVTDVVVDGAPGLTYRYVGIDTDGTVRERGLTTLVLRGDEVFWISAIGADAEGCVGRQETEFSPTVLAAFAPWYARLIEGSILPGGPAGGATS